MGRIADYAKLVFIATVIGLCCVETPVGAVSTQIGAKVCQSSSPASLQISQPRSDSVVRQARLTIKGTASLINQVEIYLDNTYQRTATVAHSSGTYQTSISLTPGTHTIDVRGNNTCTGESMQRTVVVTYEVPKPPRDAPPPSVGTDTPTVINPNPTSPGGQSDNAGGVVVSRPDPDVEAPHSEQSWFDQFSAWITQQGFSKWLIEVTDVDAAYDRPLPEWIRAVGLITGVALVVTSPLLGAALPALCPKQWTIHPRYCSSGVIIVIGFGIILISLLFLL